MSSATKQQMVINYVPGEECRVAVLEDGRLEEFHTERAGSVSFVGNIYVGRVTNVEPSIQAAFVDFGLESNGFLHVSDIHPMYFPGSDDKTEQIGRKTPRRERPPIQACLRRGQEIVVQVLKEGINTKGPTLTSYISIPGRYLVMLPDMDRVGVSRKVEDEELRREMRQALDSLELPEGFGFILRTAGEGKGKAELKRDLAYLQRLWKDMEKRRKSGGKPRWEDMLRIYEREWSAAGFEDEYQEGEYRQDGIEQLQAYYASFAADPPRVLELEKPFDLHMDRDVLIKGRMDLVNGLGGGEEGEGQPPPRFACRPVGGW